MCRFIFDTTSFVFEVCSAVRQLPIFTRIHILCFGVLKVYPDVINVTVSEIALLNSKTYLFYKLLSFIKKPTGFYLSTNTMAKIFITGSADGLGLMAAQLLADRGHEVVLHARNAKRGEEAMAALPRAKTGITGDLSGIAETKSVAEKVNALGVFDAVIHNAGVGYQEPRRVNTVDGLPQVFAVNSLAPYILSCLIEKPKRLIYISSGLHKNGNPDLTDLAWNNKPWNGFNAYADSKLHDVILAFAVARLWPDVYANALEPGWVATKMGGAGAPDSLEDGPKTQVWLAESNDPQALVTGKYFYRQKLRASHPAASDTKIQDGFLKECERLSGVVFER
jgi:NAD(P)-dependent dehydrogenase (short-subunit alcohol dehydrogenase family)